MVRFPYKPLDLSLQAVRRRRTLYLVGACVVRVQGPVGLPRNVLRGRVQGSHRQVDDAVQVALRSETKWQREIEEARENSANNTRERRAFELQKRYWSA